MNLEHYLLLAIVIFAASMLQSSTGFGFSIMSTPFLLLMFDAHSAIMINIVLSLFVSLLMIYPLRKNIDRVLLKRVTYSSLAGVPFGLAVFLLMDVIALKLTVSILILLCTILLLCKFRFHESKAGDCTAGGISGFLTASIGLPGPPLLIYFAGVGMEKARQRSTTLTFYVVVYTVSLVLQTIFNHWSPADLKAVAVSLPVSFAGILFGSWIYRFINQRLFRALSYIILFCSGTYLLYSTLY
jgi:uncharacterized membrane protein YfcA